MKVQDTICRGANARRSSAAVALCLAGMQVELLLRDSITEAVRDLMIIAEAVTSPWANTTMLAVVRHFAASTDCRRSTANSAYSEAHNDEDGRPHRNAFTFGHTKKRNFPS